VHVIRLERSLPPAKAGLEHKTERETLA